ncbi:MAG: glutamate--tRNA ligase [Flammeovirgaceae bacterium]
MEKSVRVRFAPSPTGLLHIGGLRTALFNYLFAKKHGGDFLLRIEDTDQTRYDARAEKYIQESLIWAGITPDESPWNGGEVGPYRQSERKAIYGQYAQQLLNAGHAYYAFDTPEELDAMRQRLKEAGSSNQQYNAITRKQMTNSLTLSRDEVQAKLAAGEPYVIRLKVPQKEELRLNDMVRGWVVVHSFTIDDKVIMKSDGMPTYHLANVVDDHLMGITHVIRGEEWLPSAPLHLLLYRFLGWEATMPKFAHLPLLLKPNGNGKLSKRDGDKLGFSVFPLADKDPVSGAVTTGFREDGFLAEAFVNFLALLGWNPGDEREIFSLEELVKEFDIERVSKSGAKFDIEKAKWFNQQYLKSKSETELAQLLLAELAKEGIECSEDKAQQISGLMRERVVFSHELWTNAQYFFQRPTAYNEKVIRKKWTQDAVTILTDYKDAVKEANGFSADEAKEVLLAILDKHGMGMGKVMQSLRVAVTGEGNGPDLMPLLSILGKEEVATRIATAIEKLADQVKV